MNSNALFSHHWDLPAMKGKTRMKKKHFLHIFIFGWFLLFSFFILIPNSNSQGEHKIYIPIIMNPKTHYYAQVIKYGTFYGVWATIETANPAIREPFFSYTSINILDNEGKWVETGWVKSSTSGCVPKFSWAIQPGTANIIPSPLPSIGVAYQYKIEKISDGNWRLQIMTTNGVVIYSVDISNPGMNSGVSLQAVGEVDSITKQNDMGVSGILSMKWKEVNPFWYNWDGWSFGVKDYPPYTIVGLQPNPNNNVQVSGNNGNPTPPNAPCR